MLGTTLVLKGVTPDLIKDPSGVVYSHRSPDGNWLPGGASSVGAGVILQAFRRARSGRARDKGRSARTGKRRRLSSARAR